MLLDKLLLYVGIDIVLPLCLLLAYEEKKTTKLMVMCHLNRIPIQLLLIQVLLFFAWY